MDGSNRVTKRNRQFLRKLTPYECDLDEPASAPSDPTSYPSFWATAPDPIEDNNTAECPLQSENGDCSPNPPDLQPPMPLPDASVVSQDDPTAELPPTVSDSVMSPGDQLIPTLTKANATSPLPSRPRIREKWFVNPKFSSVSDQLSTN